MGHDVILHLLERALLHKVHMRHGQSAVVTQIVVVIVSTTENLIKLKGKKQVNLPKHDVVTRFMPHNPRRCKVAGAEPGPVCFAQNWIQTRD